MIWLKFIAIQLVMLLATVVGWFLLIPFCLIQAWSDWDHTPDSSIPLLAKDGRWIDQWSAPLLRPIYNNPEDGVSGKAALVWNKEGTAKVPYMPGAWAPWRAYCWSAWRNSADNLKYVFADPKGPLVTFKLFGRTAKIGYQTENGHNVPVLSL